MANSAIEWIAVQPGAAGNTLQIVYVAGVGALGVAYAAGVVTVTLAVGGSTANAIIAALAASATSAFDHVMARNVFGSTGAGVVILAVAATNLAGGRGSALRRATLTIDPAGANNGLIYTARRPGVQGEAITVAYTVGLGAVLPIVTVAAQAISVQLNAGVSTANDVLRVLETSDQARQLVEVRHVYGSTGAGTLPAAVAAAPLANGTDGTAVRFTAGGLAGTISTITDQTVVVTVPALTESGIDELALVELDICGYVFQFQALVV